MPKRKKASCCELEETECSESVVGHATESEYLNKVPDTQPGSLLIKRLTSLHLSLDVFVC